MEHEKIGQVTDEVKEIFNIVLEASEINVRLGATWIPIKDVEKFIFETKCYTEKKPDIDDEKTISLLVCVHIPVADDCSGSKYARQRP